MQTSNYKTAQNLTTNESSLANSQLVCHYDVIRKVHFCQMLFVTLTSEPMTLNTSSMSCGSGNE